MPDDRGQHPVAPGVCSRQSTVENTNQPKAESFKFKTLHLEPRTLYRQGEAAPLLQNKIMFT